MSIRRSLLAALLLSTAALPAFAAEVLQVQKPWATGVMRGQDGQFAYCVSEARFDNDLWLIVALNPEGNVNIGVGQKDAKLPAGGQRTSTLKIDNQPVMNLPARVTKPELYVLNAGKDETVLQKLAAGQTVTIDGNAFTLAGSGAALNTLKECVNLKGGEPPQAQAAAQPQPAQPQPNAGAPSDWSVPGEAQMAAAAPAPAPAAPQVVFDAATPPAPAPAAVAPAPVPAAVAPTPEPPKDEVATLIQAMPSGTEPLPAPVASPPPAAAAHVLTPPPAAPALAPAARTTLGVRPLPTPLMNLLTNAKVRDITPTEVPAGSSYAWTSRTMKGAVREDTATPGSDIVQLAERQLGQRKAACEGTFTSSMGKPENIGALQLLTAQTRCRGKNGDDYTTLVFSLTRSGVLSTISHELPDGHRAAADRAQEGLVQALKGITG